MARIKKNINRKSLEQAIKQAEKDGPLTNRGELWKAAADIYNENNKEKITHSVVYLRVNEWEIEVKTPVGKRGRAGGPMSKETKNKIAESRKNRKSKSKKFESSEDAQQHFEELRKNTPKRFHPLIALIAKGSRTAAVKLNCLQCCGYATKEVRFCLSRKICSMWLFRPYQTKEEDADFDADGGNEPEEVVAA